MEQVIRRSIRYITIIHEMRLVIILELQQYKHCEYDITLILYSIVT